MSPSSTERAAGIAIGRDYVGFAAVGATGKSAVAEARLAMRLFSGTPAAGARSALVGALRSLAGGVARRFVPVHVSVPDAAVQWGVFELDQMPKTRTAQLDLARLRFSRQGVGAGHACACQALEREAGTPLLLGMALDEGWRRCIGEALEEAGVAAWSLSANLCRRFNRFHDRMAQASGALAALAPDAWSLLVWDERGRPRYARARWRAAPGDHAGIALEVERSILAYVQGHPERSVSRVFVAAGAETAALAQALDARTSEPCVRLAEESSGELAVAAALER